MHETVDLHVLLLIIGAFKLNQSMADALLFGGQSYVSFSVHNLLVPVDLVQSLGRPLRVLLSEVQHEIDRSSSRELS